MITDGPVRYGIGPQKRQGKRPSNETVECRKQLTKEMTWKVICWIGMIGERLAKKTGEERPCD